MNLYFDKEPVIRLGFHFNFKELVKTFPECHWDPIQKVWWVPYNADQFNCILRFFKEKAWLYYFQFQTVKPTGQPHSAESLQSVLKQVLRKFRIQMSERLNWLRHSYATPLLGSGTDLGFIQELLGHDRSKTTETCLPVGKAYTHVNTISLQNIKSPFDDLQ